MADCSADATADKLPLSIWRVDGRKPPMMEILASYKRNAKAF
jgi:hypothetical protein